MTQNSSSLIQDEEETNKIRKEIQELASELEIIVDSDIIAATLAVRIQFKCQACDRLSIANDTVLHKTNLANCIYPNCEAEYHATKEDNGSWKFKMIAASFGRYNIRVNSVCPGTIDTPFNIDYFNAQPDPEAARREIGAVHVLGRMGTAEEIAYCILFLAWNESSFVTGSSLIADGGASIFTNPAPWFLENK